MLFSIFCDSKTKECSISSFVARYRIMWLLLIAVVCIAADQGSKIWAQQTLAEKWEATEFKEIEGHMEPVQVTRYMPIQEISVIPNVFKLVYRENPAAAFSITSSLPDWFRRPFLLIVSTLATLFFMIWYYRLKEEDALLMTSFCLIIAGAIGNLIDRASMGYVIDFLELYAGIFGYPNLHWPTFNIADSCIVVGAIGIVIRTLRPKKQPIAQA